MSPGVCGCDGSGAAHTHTHTQRRSPGTHTHNVSPRRQTRSVSHTQAASSTKHKQTHTSFFESATPAGCTAAAAAPATKSYILAHRVRKNSQRAVRDMAVFRVRSSLGVCKRFCKRCSECVQACRRFRSLPARQLLVVGNHNDHSRPRGMAKESSATLANRDTPRCDRGRAFLG